MAMPADVSRLQEIFDTDPAIQSALRQVEEMRQQQVPIVNRAGQPSIMKWAQDNLRPLMERALQANGMQQMPHDWTMSLGEGGRRVGELNRKGFWDRNVDWIAPVIVGGAGVAGGLGAAGAFGGGSGASGTLAATTPALSTGTLAPTVTPALSAGVGGGVGAGGGATAALTSTMPALTDLASTVPAATGAGFAPAATSALGAGGAGTGAGVTGTSILGKLASNPETYSTLAGQLGRLGEGQAGERGQENLYGMDQNRLLASLFGAEQTASTRALEDEEAGKLDRARLQESGVLSRAQLEEGQKQSRAALGLQAPNIRTRQSILGSLLQNLQPVSFGDTGRVKVPTMSGGLTPAALNPEARRTGEILQKQAIDALLSGSDVPEMTNIPGLELPGPTDFQSGRLTPPTMTPYQDPGMGESILSGIGAAGNTFQAALEALRRQSQNPNSLSMEPPETAGG